MVKVTYPEENNFFEEIIDSIGEFLGFDQDYEPEEAIQNIIDDIWPKGFFIRLDDPEYGRDFVEEKFREVKEELERIYGEVRTEWQIVVNIIEAANERIKLMDKSIYHDYVGNVGFTARTGRSGKAPNFYLAVENREEGKVYWFNFRYEPTHIYITWLNRGLYPSYSDTLKKVTFFGD